MGRKGRKVFWRVILMFLESEKPEDSGDEEDDGEEDEEKEEEEDEEEG